MSVTAKQLLEERAPIAHQIRALNDKVQAEKREFTAEEDAQWATMNADYDLLTRRLDMANRAEAIAHEQESPIDARNDSPGPGRSDFDGRKSSESFDATKAELPTEADRALALQAWVRVQNDIPLTPAHERACRLTGVNAHQKQLAIGIPDRTYNAVRGEFVNALSGNSLAGGGVTKPEGFVQNLEMALLAYTQMRMVADVIRTSDGNPLPWPTVDNTSNTGYIVGENQTNTTVQEPTFNRRIWSAYEYTSGFIKIPNSFLIDSAFNLAAIAAQMQGEMIGRRQATDFTTGDGVNKATGFVTSCVANSATQAAASATAISFDDLYNLKHSIDPAYRTIGCQWMLHDSVLLAIRKLKNGNGDYLWQPSRVTGQPDTIDGDPLFINQAMDSTIASGKYTVAYGQFSKYKIRDVNNIILRRADERYIENNQTAFIAFLRSDGNLLDAGRKPIKLLSH